MLRPVKRGVSTAWARPKGMSEILHALLSARGVKSDAEAAYFLAPSIARLHDPFLLPGMKEGVERIRLAKARSEKICVYGDYDVDGVSATALLTLFLRSIGLDVEPYIPSRHEEGYGLNDAAVENIAGRASLLISVDCGVTGADQVRLAKELSLDVIVTDHHQMGSELPDCPVIDPWLGGYPETVLCGAGVAFKLASAVGGKPPLDLIDLAALATVADVVPLIGENRVIVAEGLRRMNESPRPGIEALMEAASLRKGTLRAENIGFQLGPRLNAGGRIGDASRSLKLLMAESITEAFPIARALNDENAKRRDVEKAILDDANEQMARFDFANKSVIVLSGKDWNVGVVGLAASRLAEKYHYPTVLLRDNGEELVGSCRSIPGIDIHEALTRVSHLLVRFGGHKQAAGLTLRPENLLEFEQRLNEAVRDVAAPDAYVPSIEYDLEIPLLSLTEPLARSLLSLEPTGVGNPTPVFLSKSRVISARAIGREDKHLKIQMGVEDGRSLDGVWFGAGDLANRLPGTERMFVYEPSLNEYMGRVKVECMVRAAMPPDAIHWPEWRLFAAPMHEFLTSVLYNSKLSTGCEKECTIVDMVEWMRNDARGTLILAGSVESAKQMCGVLVENGLAGRFELSLGAWPEDPRGFNCVCVMPGAGRARGYARCVALDGVAEWMSEGFSERYRLQGAPPGWLSELPGVEELRSAYVALREMFSVPRYSYSFGAMASDLAQHARISNASAVASLVILSDMGLIGYTLEPPEVVLKPVRKVDPDSSAAYRFLSEARSRAVEMGATGQLGGVLEAMRLEIEKGWEHD